MKHLLCPLMMMLALIVGSQTVNAQKFSSMTEEQRNDTLNKLALKVYYAPKFAKYNVEGNYGKARVSSYTIKGKPSSESTPNPYEAARVVFSDKLGIPWFIEFLTKDRLIFDRWDSPEAF